MLDFPLPYGYGWQYHFLIWLQAFQTATLDSVAKLLSLAGMEVFYILVLSILYWSVQRKLGMRLLYVFLSSMFVNAWLKDTFQILRPIGIPGIKSSFLSSGVGYAMPSGHAQGAMSFWLMVGFWLRKGWLWFVFIPLILAIGISRLYLGLHWPLDVLVGWGLGWLFAVIGWGLGGWWSYRHYSFQIRIAFAIGLPALLLLVQNDVWAALYGGLLLGVGVGAVLEEQWLGVDINPLWWKRVSAAFIGIAGLIAVQWLVKAISVWPLYAADLAVLRGVLIGLWGTLGAPYVFYKSGLYQRKESA